MMTKSATQNSTQSVSSMPADDLIADWKATFFYDGFAKHVAEAKFAWIIPGNSH